MPPVGFEPKISAVERPPEECVVVCDLETSRMGAPYIYDISTLKVNDLTFILLTWRKWLAPNNASRQQMGFNSGFKVLMPSDGVEVCVALNSQCKDCVIF